MSISNYCFWGCLKIWYISTIAVFPWRPIMKVPIPWSSRNHGRWLKSYKTFRICPTQQSTKAMTRAPQLERLEHCQSLCVSNPSGTCFFIGVYKNLKTPLPSQLKNSWNMFVSFWTPTRQKSCNIVLYSFGNGMKGINKHIPTITYLILLGIQKCIHQNEHRSWTYLGVSLIKKELNPDLKILMASASGSFS